MPISLHDYLLSQKGTFLEREDYIAMKNKLTRRPCRYNFIILISLTFQVILTFGVQPQINPSYAQSPPFRRINVPYLEGVAFTPAIFWFGQVTPTSNYADVRVYYYNNQVEFFINIIDRLLWYDTAPSGTELAGWDSVSLYLKVDGNSGSSPDANTYQFLSQVNWWENDASWQASYQGNGSGWDSAQIDFTSKSNWRGNALNDDFEDAGWSVHFTIPFSSLGISDPPSQGAKWGLAVSLHDRDDYTGTPIPDQIWPEWMVPDQPKTWGEMSFGIPEYYYPPSLPAGTTTIRHGLNGVVVEDAHVGGHTTCGDGTKYFLDWGDTNYSGYDQINIQNQWDIADWGCFSKYYVRFPLDNVPKGQVIISARLTMYLFGNAGGGIWGEPPDSYIQVFNIGQTWQESTITWNNAPLAQENITGIWVYPMQEPLIWPGELYTWDVSRAVIEAYADGHPLNLAFYSADGPMHTGKYFSSSDIGDWDEVGRPTLIISWGDLCSTANTSCSYIYLPIISP
jgi:hypothetical protein